MVVVLVHDLREGRPSKMRLVCLDLRYLQSLVLKIKMMHL